MGFDLFNRPIRDSRMKRQESGAAQIYPCIVEGVSEDKGTVMVRCPAVGKTFDGVVVCQNYVHPDSDEGTHYTPRIGSFSFLMLVSGQPFLMPAFFSPLNTESGSYLGRARTTSHQGDQWIGTRDGNFIEVLSGGIIQIFAHGLLRSIFNPLRQKLTTIARRLAFQSDACVEEHESDDKNSTYRKEVTVVPTKPALYRHRINKDEHFIVEIYDQAGETKYVSLQCQPGGDVVVDIENNESISIGKNLIAELKKDVISHIYGDSNITHDGIITINDGAKWVAREGDGVAGMTEVGGSPPHQHEIKIENVKISEHSSTMKTT